MVLSTNKNTKKLWEHEFEFTYSVKLTADQLFLKASVDNKGGKDFELTFCFHTYFRVPKVTDASVKGNVISVVIMIIYICFQLFISIQF